MENLINELLIKIGEDPKREGLLKTPHRVAKAYEFLTAGYNADIDAIITRLFLLKNIRKWSW